MLKYIHVKPVPADLRAIVLAGEARDANLTACLLYLLVAGDEGGMVAVSALAKTFGVGDFTVTRWLRRLSKLGLVVVRLSGDGMLELDVKLRKGLGAVENPDQHDGLGGSGEHLDILFDPVPPTDHDLPLLARTQLGRFDAALEALKACPTLTERARKKGGVSTLAVTVHRVVRNSLFDGLDLPDELRHADAWVNRKAYTDMPKFLMNWLRREAKKKKPMRNANAAPTGKYEAAQAAARGK